MKTTSTTIGLFVFATAMLFTNKLFSSSPEAEEKDYTFIITIITSVSAFIVMFAAKIWYDKKEEKERTEELKNRNYKAPLSRTRNRSYGSTHRRAIS